MKEKLLKLLKELYLVVFTNYIGSLVGICVSYFFGLYVGESGNVVGILWFLIPALWIVGQSNEWYKK